MPSGVLQNIHPALAQDQALMQRIRAENEERISIISGQTEGNFVPESATLDTTLVRARATTTVPLYVSPLTDPPPVYRAGGGAVGLPGDLHRRHWREQRAAAGHERARHPNLQETQPVRLQRRGLMGTLKGVGEPRHFCLQQPQPPPSSSAAPCARERWCQATWSLPEAPRQPGPARRKNRLRRAMTALSSSIPTAGRSSRP